MGTDPPNPTQRHIEAFHRFLKVVVHDKDRTLLVLHAHILIEEQVRQIVDERLKNKAALSDARLDCHQCICLAQSLFPADFQPYLWVSLKKLNKIRNDIAHNITPAGLEHRMNDLVKAFPSGWHTLEENDSGFELTLWSIFSSVAELVEKPSAVVLQIVRKNAV